MKNIFFRLAILLGALWLAQSNVGLAQTTNVSDFVAGDLIKGSGSAVYYFASDGRRYVFPNEKTYFTWYADFSRVKTIPDGHLSTIPLGRTNVTYRPGRKMLKIMSDPRTYVVDRGGVLRHITTEQLAMTLYGISWKQQVDDLPDSFFANYRVGTAIQSATDFDPQDVMTLTTRIDQDKGFEQNKVTVSIGNRDAGFVPTTFTVKRGTQVTWTNRDVETHTVTGSGWGSGNLAPDQSFTYTFNTAGSFDYRCSLHPVMQGTINVVP